MLGNRFHVVVTQEDIDNGLREDPECCPIARAMGRVIGEPVCVGEHLFDFVTVEGEGAGGLMRYPLPEEAKRFVLAFDCMAPVSPFEFDVDFDNLQRAP